MSSQVERSIARSAQAEAIAKQLVSRHFDHGDPLHVARSEAIAEMVGAITIIASHGPNPVGTIMVALAGLSTAGAIAATIPSPRITPVGAA